MTSSYFCIDKGIFDITNIQFVYPTLDLSHNLYRTICDVIDQNQRQLCTFRHSSFRDDETRILLIHGTEDMIHRLTKFKMFLQKYQLKLKNEKTYHLE